MCVSMRDIKGYYVPCGVCYECLSVRRNSWAARNKLEYQVAKSCYFVTLTYNAESYSRLRSYPSLSLSVPLFSDFQNFMKRLRSFLSCKVRYFCCHEYGSLTQRGHYHALIYLDDNVKLTVPDVFRLWRCGNVTVSRANDARIHYMTKYLTKSVRYQSDWRNVISSIIDYCGLSVVPRYYENGNFAGTSEMIVREFLNYYLDNPSIVLPPDVDITALRSAVVYYNTFLRMSLKPAIGSSLLEDSSWVNWLREYAQANGSYPSLSLYGCVYPMPRYFIHRVFSPLERLLVAGDYVTEIIEEIEYRSAKYGLTVEEYMDNVRMLSDSKLNFLESLQIQKESLYLPS